METESDSRAGNGAAEVDPGRRPFEWRVWADATCAGLTPLIPLPLVDLAFERFFRRRMPTAIARARGRELDPRALEYLRRPSRPWLSWSACLTLPVALVLYVARKIFRKLVYVLAMADASTALSEYWHRAGLIDHMVRAGHLDRDAPVDWPLAACDHVLRTSDTDSLRSVARQVVGGTSHVFRKLIRARRHGGTELSDRDRTLLEAHWAGVERSVGDVVRRYDELLRSWSASSAPPAR